MNISNVVDIHYIYTYITLILKLSYTMEELIKPLMEKTFRFFIWIKN